MKKITNNTVPLIHQNTSKKLSSIPDPEPEKPNFFSSPLKFFLDRLNIRGKIVCGYALTIGIAVVGTSTGLVVGEYYRQNAAEDIIHAQDEAYRVNTLKIALLEVVSYQQKVIVAMRNSQQFDYKQYKYESSYLLHYLESARDIAREIKIYKYNIDSASEIALLETGDRDYADTTESYKQQIEVILNQINGEFVKPSKIREVRGALIDFSNTEVALRFAKLSDKLSKQIDISYKKHQEATRALAQVEKLRREIISGSILLSVAIAAALALHTSRAIAQPLKAANNIARRVSEDANFLLQATVTTHDEVGQLTTSLNQLIQRAANHTRELQQVGQQLDEFFNLSFDMLGIAGFDGYFKRINPAFEKTLGYSRTELLSTRFFDFVHPEDRSESQAFATQLANGEMPQCFENRYRCKDGSYKWLAWTIVPFLSGGLMYVVARDISDRKQAESALKQFAEQLEIHVSERTLELNNAIEQLQSEIARRASVEEVLQESEQRINSILNSLDNVVWSVSATNFALLYINPAVEKIYGYSAQEFLEKPTLWREVVHPDDSQRFDGYYQDVLAMGNLEIEYRIVRIDGEVRWINDRSRVAYNENSKAIRIDGIITDITERKLATEELLQTTASLQGIFQAFPDLYFRLDETGTILDYNTGGTFSLYVSSAEFLGKKMQDVLPPSIGNKINEAILQVHKTNSLASIEYALPMPNGENFFEARLLRFYQKQILVIVRNISDRKQAEAALRDSEVELRALFGAMNDVILVLDRQGRYLKIVPTNPSLAYKPTADLVGKTMHEILPPAQADWFVGYIQHALELKQTVNIEYSLNVEDREIWFDASIAPLQSDSVIWVARDISQRKLAEAALLDANETLEIRVKERTTELYKANKKLHNEIAERKYAEEALRSSREFLQNVIDTNPSLIFVKDWDGKFILVNQAFASFYGTSVEFLIGKSNADFDLNQEQVERYLRSDREVMITQREKFIPEEAFTTPDGEVRWVQTIKKPFVGADGSGRQLLGVATDITERKQALEALRQSEAQLREQANALQQAMCELRQTQTQLIQTEKMSSLGQMVAGIAHEINNPINFIHGNLSHAQDYVQDLMELVQMYRAAYPNPPAEIQTKTDDIDLEFLASDLPRLLSSMNIGTERIRQMVLSLRNFSRLDETGMKSVDLHEGIDSTLLILNNRIKTEVTVIKQYGELPPIECYPAQLNQVFMNIISNGIDALMDMPKQREKQIVIATKLLEQNQIVVRIRDNGPGINKEIKDKIFDPFFTTKDVGKGTGLGLSICYQIIEKHQGKIEVNSQMGEGTEFAIALPVKQLLVDPPSEAPSLAKVAIMN